jgi:hypothetical protein
MIDQSATIETYKGLVVANYFTARPHNLNNPISMLVVDFDLQI